MLVWEAEEAATYGMFYTRNPIESPQEHLKSSANQFCQPSGLRGPSEKESCRLSRLLGQASMCRRPPLAALCGGSGKCGINAVMKIFVTDLVTPLVTLQAE